TFSLTSTSCRTVYINDINWLRQGWAIGAVFATCGWRAMLDRTRLAGGHNTKLDFNKLFYLAIHSHPLRRLAPAAVEQRICGHNTRCRGRLWLSHNADKRIYRCLGVTARQRSYFGWCNGHLSAFSSLARSPTQRRMMPSPLQ